MCGRGAAAAVVMMLARMRRRELGFMAKRIAVTKLKMESAERFKKDVEIDNQSEGQKHKI